MYEYNVWNWIDFCLSFQNQFHLDIIVLIVVDHHVQNCATIDIKLLKLKTKMLRQLIKNFVKNQIADWLFIHINDFKTIFEGFFVLPNCPIFIVCIGQVNAKEHNSKKFKSLVIEFFIWN